MTKLEIYHSCINQEIHSYEIVQLYSICLSFLARTCFGHYCDHLEGVPQYKYQKYKTPHKIHNKILQDTFHYKAAQNLLNIFDM